MSFIIKIFWLLLTNRLVNSVKVLFHKLKVKYDSWSLCSWDPTFILYYFFSLTIREEWRMIICMCSVPRSVILTLKWLWHIAALLHFLSFYSLHFRLPEAFCELRISSTVKCRNEHLLTTSEGHQDLKL